MKTIKIDIFLALLLLGISLGGCSIKRQMQKQKAVTTEESRTDESVRTITDATTTTELSVQSKTKIVESVDTVITVPVPPTGDARLDEFLKNNPLRVPVTIHRTIERQDFTRKNEQKKENATTDQNKAATIKKNTENLSKRVDAETKNYTGVLLISGGCILVVLLFVFLWKRIPLTGILDKFKRKSPG